MATIKTLYEPERRCGRRVKGGIYLVGGKLGNPCCKLPCPLHVCNQCGSGIRPVRGFTWINTNLFMDRPCDRMQSVLVDENEAAEGCIMNESNLRVGLLWVGTQNYNTADDFMREAAAQGISKRISQIPKDLKIGETWVMLAHKKAVLEYGANNEPIYKAGIFRAFKPEEVQYVVKGNETTAQLEAIEKRGMTLVDVRPLEDAQATIPTMEVYDPADKVYIHKIGY